MDLLDWHSRAHRQCIGKVTIAFGGDGELQAALIGEPGAGVPRQRAVNGDVVPFQKGVREGFVERLSLRNGKQMVLAAMTCELD